VYEVVFAQPVHTEDATVVGIVGVVNQVGPPRERGGHYSPVPVEKPRVVAETLEVRVRVRVR